MSTKSLDDTMRSSQISNASNVQYFIKCFGQNEGIHMCLNDKCKSKNAFTCSNKMCKCQQLHIKCQKGNIQNVLNSVTSKIEDTRRVATYIQNTIEDLIDQLHQLKVDLLEQVEQRGKYVKLIDIQKKFMKVLNGTVKQQQMNSTQLKQLWSLAKVPYDKNKYSINLHLMQVLSIHKSNIQNNINQTKNRLNAKMTDIENYQKKIYIPLLTRQLTATQTKLTEEITKVSKICETDVMSQNLIKYFNKKVEKFERVFCASENQFSISKFFEQNGTKRDLLFLCKTSQDKIIGAYSPYHHFSGKWQWVKDNQGNSFIFSLTDNQKFHLRQLSYSINRTHEKNLIKFGNNELSIGDKCNTNNSFRTDVDCDYYFKATYGGMGYTRAYTKFNGSSSNCTTLKQWQVYKVQFCQ